MKRSKRRATLFLCAAMAVSFAGSAVAKPVHKAKLRPQAATQSLDPRSPDAQPYPFPDEAQAPADKAAKANSQSIGEGRAARTGDAYGGFTSNTLVSEARKYLGTNPTNEKKSYCLTMKYHQ